MKLPVFDLENWREIGATLSRNKTRTFMTAFGIFWGTAMLAFLWGGAKGFQDVMMRNFEGFATNLGIISSHRTTLSYNGYSKGTNWDLTTEDVENIRKFVPEVETISSFLSRTGTAAFGTKSTSISLQGVEPGYTKIMEPIIYEGRFINEADDAGRAKVCVLGKKIASDLFGVENPLGEHVNVNGIYYTVVGVAGQIAEVSMGGAKLDESVAIPMSVMQTSYNVGRDIDCAMFTAKSSYAPSSLIPRIKRVIQARHPNLHPDDQHAIRFMDISEQFAMVDSLFLGITILALFVGAGTLLAGVIGVGNIMWIIVKERTREIGIRRAIGAKPSDIIMQILSESVVLTLIAGAAGVVFASIILGVLAHSYYDPMLPTPRFELSFTTAVTILALFLVLGSAAGLVPAIKAMKIKPVEAMNDK